MLRRFLAEHREELIRRSRSNVAKRIAPQASEKELEEGVPLFLEQLAETLRMDEEESESSRPNIGEGAARYGSRLLGMGFMVAQVVHGYGDVCQAIMQLAIELKAPITSEEFRTLNRCLDAAIAAAVTEYARQRERSTSDQEVERLGFLAHELRNLVSTGLLSYQMLRAGSLDVSGSTGAILGRSLMGLRALTDRTLAEVRLEAGVKRRAQVRLIEFIEDVEASAVLEAQSHGIGFTVAPLEDDTVVVDIDRQILASAVANLLQNAFKFTRRHGQVCLRARRNDDRVLIEVEDECGGLPPDKEQTFFRPFTRRGTDQTGMGLGLAISRQGVRANGGDLYLRNLPGKGCVFTIELPVSNGRSSEEPDASGTA